MHLVHISKLRSQLSALSAHFNNPERFNESLISLFRMYEQKQSTTNQWLRKNPQSAYNVPDSVLNELETVIADLARKMPREAILNADKLWQNGDDESRKTALALIANLGDAHADDFLQRVQKWLRADLEVTTITDIFSVVEANPKVVQSVRWLNMIKNWLETREISVVKFGLQALNRTIPKNQQNLPIIFNLITPVISNPVHSLQKELVGTIQALINLSEAETASYLMMIGELYPKDEVKMFLRKCLPLFSNFYQSDLRRDFSV